MMATILTIPRPSPQTGLTIKTPLGIFSQWFEEAEQSGIKEPSAVFLATATKRGAPSCRVVLLKAFDEQGFVIYTNMLSRKGRELTKNPQAALCFYWQGLGKQVRIEGYTTTVSDKEADTYFASRNVKSRIGAWASKQSEPMKDKNDLLKRVAYYTAKWATGNVARPPHWTGVRIVPDYFEFWQSAGQIPERQVFFLRDNAWRTALLHP